MRLGFFDGSPSFKSLGKDHVCSDEHIEVAAEAAREGVVLLKNGVPCRYATPLDDISSYGEVIYEMGCGEMACWNDSLIFPATEAAKEAGVTLLLMGLDLSIEAESWIGWISFSRDIPDSIDKPSC